MKRLRLYVDTSVIGGCLDQQFAAESSAFIALAIRGKLTLVVSDLLRLELSRAPHDVQQVLNAISDETIDSIAVTQESESLRDAYLAAGVVGPASAADALHVALATVNRADAIASWNFRHIVQFEKIRGFNAVNMREGYAPLEIRSPREFLP